MIAGIDPATTIGVAVEGPEGIYTEKWDLSCKAWEKNNIGHGCRMNRFYVRLMEFLKKHQVSWVGYEYVSGKGYGAIHHAKLCAIIELVCFDLGIGVVHFAATSIKKFATGNGRADKDDMVIAAQPFVNVTDHNEADAVHILNMTRDWFAKRKL